MTHMTRIFTFFVYQTTLISHKFFDILFTKKILRKMESRTGNQVSIQAGSKGLEGAFYAELVQSAIETLGDTTVNIDSINREKSYLNQVFKNSKVKNSKYIILDPRTLHSNLFVGILQAFFSSYIYKMNAIKPIVILTDASVVKWRLMSLVWTSAEGICLMLMEPQQLKNVFPHNRTYGPIFIPISKKRRSISNPLLTSSVVITEPKFGFQGTIYPERKKFLDKFQLACESLEVHFCIQEKNEKSTNDEYWKFIDDHDVVITSTMQTNIENNFADHLNVNQLVFRISEVISTGTLLISTPVSGMEKFFKPDVDFIQVEEIEDVMDSCKVAIANVKNQKNSIASNAKKNYEELIENKCFWRMLEIEEVGECKREICTCTGS